MVLLIDAARFLITGYWGKTMFLSKREWYNKIWNIMLMHKLSTIVKKKEWGMYRQRHNLKRPGVYVWTFGIKIWEGILQLKVWKYREEWLVFMYNMYILLEMKMKNKTCSCFRVTCQRHR